MSSISKGDEFEARVFDALSEELRSERLIVAPKRAQIFRKKAYHSRDRQANITTDVSIEAYLPDRELPTLVWVFECKDYSGSVPVDDIEEFHAKLQQIGEDNTKGTFVTSGALQKGARTYAESKKIGVVRLLPSDQLITILEFLTAASLRKLTGLSFPLRSQIPNIEAGVGFLLRMTATGFQIGIHCYHIRLMAKVSGPTNRWTRAAGACFSTCLVAAKGALMRAAASTPPLYSREAEMSEEILEKIMKAVGKPVEFRYPGNEGTQRGRLIDRAIIVPSNPVDGVPYWDVVDLIEFQKETAKCIRVGYYRKKDHLRWGSQTTIVEPVAMWKRILVETARKKKWFHDLLDDVMAELRKGAV